jgi:hypothetical protein
MGIHPAGRMGSRGNSLRKEWLRSSQYEIVKTAAANQKFSVVI